MPIGIYTKFLIFFSNAFKSIFVSLEFLDRPLEHAGDRMAMLKGEAIMACKRSTPGYGPHCPSEFSALR